MPLVGFEPDRLYPRVTDLDDGRTVSIYQSEIGDVGCVVWDAAIVLAKYFEHLWSEKALTFITDGQTDPCLVKLIGRLTALVKDTESEHHFVELGAGTGYVGIVAAALG